MSDSRVRQPKHRQIFEHIRAAIAAGQYQAGHRVPSEAALSRRFDTSRPTVARAMRDLEQAGYVERRVGSGTYVLMPQEVASKMFALLIPGLGSTEIFEPMCAEIAHAVQALNFTLLWGHSSPSDASDANHVAQELCQQYIEQRVAGVFFAPVELTPGMDETNHQIATALSRAGIPIVLLDRDVERFPCRSQFDLVGIDNRRVGFVLAEHLLRLGCRRIHFVARPGSAPTVDARIVGWRDALICHGIQPEPAWLRRGDPADMEFVRELCGLGVETDGFVVPALAGRAGARPAENPLKRALQNVPGAPCPEAFICANDFTAANLMQNLLRQGVRVPQAVRVVGIDDVKYASLLSVPLTTVRQPCREMGAAAVAAMIQRIENRALPARDILLDFRLVVRESCGAATLTSSMEYRASFSSLPIS